MVSVVVPTAVASDMPTMVMMLLAGHHSLGDWRRSSRGDGRHGQAAGSNAQQEH
jgi:hypothetical protein